MLPAIWWLVDAIRHLQPLNHHLNIFSIVIANSSKFHLCVYFYLRSDFPVAIFPVLGEVELSRTNCCQVIRAESKIIKLYISNVALS